MMVIRESAELDAAARRRGRVTGLGGIFVPTMGALHEGHAALIRRGAELSRECGMPGACVVSIFVNPTQFNEKADFERYPKTLEADLAMCREAGAGAVFVPSVEMMYPDAAAPPVPPLPGVATEPGLEDRFRPGHFAGVCQVVMRLFRMIEPDAAIFGEKDWQQYQVVAAMTREAGLRTTIIGYPTIRDPDGLAMSSRNRFLSASERGAALAIPKALKAAGGVRSASEAERTMRGMLAGLDLEYAVVRDAATLGPVGSGLPGRALIAARSGKTRLIDNAPWPG